MAVRRTRIFGGLLGGYRWREIPRRRSRSILHGILFGWRGKPLVKSRGKRGDTYSRGEGGIVATKNWKRSTKVFFGGRHSTRDSRLWKFEREKERGKKLPLPSFETPSYEDTFGLLFFFFFWERSDIVRRCNLELELFSLLAPDISTRRSFFPWIRRGVS